MDAISLDQSELNTNSLSIIKHMHIIRVKNQSVEWTYHRNINLPLFIIKIPISNNFKAPEPHEYLL
jgi:hypothetical protein